MRVKTFFATLLFFSVAGCGSAPVMVKEEKSAEVFSRIHFYLEALHGEKDSIVLQNEGLNMLLRVYAIPILKEDAFTNAELEIKSDEKYRIMMEVGAAGKEKVAEVTRKYQGRRVAVVLDETLVGTPYIKDEITNGRLRFNGHLTLDESRALLVKILATIRKNREK